MPWVNICLILITLERSTEANKELTYMIRSTNSVLDKLLKTLSDIFIGTDKEDDLTELMIKPVAGTLDVITLTTRKVSTAPTAIYLKLNDIFKKRPIAHPSSMFSLNTKQTKASRDSMKGGFEILIDENELKRQLKEELDKVTQHSKGIVIENIDKNIKEEIKNIQQLQFDILEKKRNENSVINTKNIVEKVTERLSADKKSEELFEDIDEEKDLKYDFSGFTSTMGEPDPEFDEELTGFDKIDEFDEMDASPLNSDQEILDDFVPLC